MKNSLRSSFTTHVFSNKENDNEQNMKKNNFKSESQQKQKTLQLKSNSKITHGTSGNGDLLSQSKKLKSQIDRVLAHSQTTKSLKGAPISLNDVQPENFNEQLSLKNNEFFLQESILKKITHNKRLWKREKISQTHRLSSDFCIPTMVFRSEVLEKVMSQFDYVNQNSLTVNLEIINPKQEKCLQSISFNYNDDIDNQKNFKKSLQSNSHILNVPVIFQQSPITIQEFEIMSQGHERKIKQQLNLFKQIDSFTNKENQNNYNSDLNKGRQESFEVYPLNFLSFNFQVQQKRDLSLDTRLDILAPNVSFDFYQINNLQISQAFLQYIQNENQQQGYLLLDKSQKLKAVHYQDQEVLQTPVVGLWFKNLPLFSQDSQIPLVKHPLVWAQCMKFMLQSEQFSEIYSPSSDKNTFLVAVFDEDKQFLYEFKPVRNDQEKQYLNNWVIVSVSKKLNYYQNQVQKYDDLIIKAQVFKKPDIIYDKYRVFTFKKYYERLRERLPSNESRVGSNVQFLQASHNIQALTIKQFYSTQVKQNAYEGNKKGQGQQNLKKNHSLDQKQIVNVKNNQSECNFDQKYMSTNEEIDEQDLQNMKCNTFSQRRSQSISEHDNEEQKQTPVDDKNQFLSLINSQQNKQQQQRSKLNIGKFVPNIKVQMINLNQAGAAAASSILKTSTDSMNIIVQETNNELSSHQPVKTHQFAQSIVSLNRAMFTPGQKSFLPHGRNVQKFSSRNGSVFSLQSHDLLSRNGEQINDIMSSPFQIDSTQQKIIHTPISILREFPEKENKIEIGTSVQNGMSSHFNNSKNSQQNDELNGLPKKLDFSEDQTKSKKGNDVQDFSEAIDHCKSSPTSKEIMLEQSKTIRILQQQVQDLQKVILDLQTKSQSTSKTNHSGISSSTAGSRNNEDNNQSKKTLSQNTNNDKSAEINKNNQQFKSFENVGQRCQSPQNINPGENQLISAFVDFIRQSQQKSGFQEILNAFNGTNCNSNTENTSANNQNQVNPQNTSNSKVQLAEEIKEESKQQVPNPLLTKSVKEAFQLYESDINAQKVAQVKPIQPSTIKVKQSQPISRNAAQKQTQSLGYQDSQRSKAAAGMITLDSFEGKESLNIQREENSVERKGVFNHCQESPIMNATSISDSQHSHHVVESRDESQFLNQKEESQYIKQLNNILQLRIYEGEDEYYITNANKDKPQDQAQQPETLIPPPKIQKSQSKKEEAKTIFGKIFYQSQNEMMNNKRFPHRMSNGGNQADDENDTYRDSDVSLAILGKKPQKNQQQLLQ